MIFAGTSFGSCPIANPCGDGTVTSLNSWPQRPFHVAIDSVESYYKIHVNTLSISDELGEKTTAEFIMVNPSPAPTIGQSVRITWYDQVIFAGSIDSITRAVDPSLLIYEYRLSCVDHSHILFRRKISRNFTNISLTSLFHSIILNELAGEPITFGDCDASVSLPFVAADDATVFDVLKDAAGVVGQTFYVDWDGAAHFVSTSAEDAPLALTDSVVEAATRKDERDQYRNRQRVIATGTPPDAATDATTFTYVRQDDDQIAARAAIEGGTGIYDEVVKVTHPFSNDPIELYRLAYGTAIVLLMLSGSLSKIVTTRVRSYGFRAGQSATMTLNSISVSGTWIIQRVRAYEEDGRRLIYELELSQSSVLRRSYDSWLAIVGKGKVTALPPASAGSYANLATYTSNDTFVVPAGVTIIEIVCVGGGGGGGGGVDGLPPIWGGGSDGGAGGSGGKALRVINVTEDDAIVITVGSGGTAGVTVNYPSASVAGGNGGLSKAVRGSVELCRADAGTGGTGGVVSTDGVDGSDGSGLGDVVFPAAGGAGGSRGLGSYPNPMTQPTAGGDGYVEIRY